MEDEEVAYIRCDFFFFFFLIRSIEKKDKKG